MIRIVIFFILSLNGLSSVKNFKSELVFDKCPETRLKVYTEDLKNSFKKERSLLKLKKKIISDNALKKFHLEEYKVNYIPHEKLLSFHFKCPEVIAKLSFERISKDKKKEQYSLLLSKSGNLFDPNLEIELRSEKLLVKKLPTVYFKNKLYSDELVEQIKDFIMFNEQKVGLVFSELMFNKKDQLIGIHSNKNNAISIFFGKHFWEEKLERFHRGLKYFSKRKKLPSLVKFVSNKKMVVRFSRAL